LTRTSEQSRISIGTALKRGLLSGSIDASLEEIEAISTSSFPRQDDVKIGPFAVLDLTSVSDVPRGPSASNTTDRTTEQSHPEASNDRLHATHPSFASEELLGLPDDSLQWSDIFGLNDNLYGITSNFSFDSMNCPNFSPFSRWLVSESEIYNASLAMNLDLTHNMVHEERQAHCTSILQTTLDSPVASVDILNDASFLVKVFQKHVISQLTIVPLGKKGP
jgi:arginine metabolism regulation protein II